MRIHVKEFFSKPDIISIHVRLNNETKNLISSDDFSNMRFDSLFVNTSRAGLIEEGALLAGLNKGRPGNAAVDVFECEPYEGELKNCGNIVLTAHMGSMTLDCRSQMELEACEEAARYLNGNNLLYPALV